MNAKYPLKLYILTAVIVFVSINANVFQCLYEVIEEYIPSIGFEDEVSLYDKRYGILKALLPPHELVGYLTDEDYNPRVFNLTQYAMSPFLLTYSIKPRFVITNFTDYAKSDQRIRYVKDNGFVLIKKVNNSVMLFRRETR
ncbi:MAG: hypothetical protein BWK80_50200 [Desulfobacteraceae bacterium IS3]|nr:MAG: hypothetical protein BWK80_50200 [Desulfobacteraceae bacterium IS3]HAO22107.1 hypothetical protein [Desulfobacteraceae bacterium]